MVETKISRRLEAGIAKLVFNLGRNKSATSYLDRLVVELLRDECSFASQLATLLLPQGLDSIYIRHLEQYIQRYPKAEVANAKTFYTKLCERLYRTIETSHLSSAHILCYALAKPDSHTSLLAGYYCLTAEDVATMIRHLTTNKKGENINLSSTIRNV